MSHRDYALFLFEQQKRDRCRRLKAQIRARLLANSSIQNPQSKIQNRMSCIKNYLNDLVFACVPDNGFTQEAIEHAVMNGTVTLSGEFNLEKDTLLVMSQYDRIIAGYHTVIHGRDRDQSEFTQEAA
jgi:hypothetical protein